MPERMCHFVSSESIRDIVEKVFKKIKIVIQNLLPDAEVEHVGSSAVEGILTKKDLDITVRVPIDDFSVAMNKLSENFKPIHQEVWQYNQDEQEGLAIFKVPDTKRDTELESIDIMLVVKDSRFDEYHILVEILKKDKCVKQDYNKLKEEHNGKPYGQYRKDKSAFWGDHG